MTDKQLLIVGGVTLGVFYFIGHKALAGVGSAVDAIAPANPDNIFYRGVNAVGDTFDDGDGNGSFSLGSWIYDLIHSDEV